MYIHSNYDVVAQFLKAISVIHKLSPINFSEKCCGKFSICLTKFFFCQSNCTKFFVDYLRKEEKRAVHRLCRGIKRKAGGDFLNCNKT